MEVRFSHLDDPVGFLSQVLKKQAEVLTLLQDNPKTSISSIYAQNRLEIDGMLSHVISSWHILREATVGFVGAVEEDSRAKDSFSQSVIEAHRVSQKCLLLFDDLCTRYDLPRKEPLIFAKLGGVLHQ